MWQDSELIEPVAASYNSRSEWLRGGKISDELGSFFPTCWKEYCDNREHRPEQDTDIPTILKKDREDCCFFYKYIPGMTFSTAEKLRSEESSYREVKKGRSLKLLGIIVAAIVAIILVIVTAIVTLSSK